MRRLCGWGARIRLFPTTVFWRGPACPRSKTLSLRRAAWPWKEDRHMPAEIVMPKVDMVMENGTFIEWLKQEGDLVSKGEPLFVIGTDKADIEVEAPASGQLANLGATRDDVIPVSTVIGYIVQPGEALGATAPAAIAPVVSNGQGEALTAVSPAQTTEPIRSTPLARAQARELG